MTDTVKIARPHFLRKPKGVSGRVEHDDKGNAVWVRTRSTDSPEIAEPAELALVEEQSNPARVNHGSTRRKISPNNGSR